MKRVAMTIMSAIVAWPQAVTKDLVQFPVVVVIGLLAHRVLSPSILRIAAKKAEEVGK